MHDETSFIVTRFMCMQHKYVK